MKEFILASGNPHKAEEFEELFPHSLKVLPAPGKVEVEETLEQAIQREIYEELNIKITPQKLLITMKHQYPDFYLTMHCFICDYR